MIESGIAAYGLGHLPQLDEFVVVRLQQPDASDPARVAEADRVVFPGQGAMPDCMR